MLTRQALILSLSIISTAHAQAPADTQNKPHLFFEATKVMAETCLIRSELAMQRYKLRELTPEQAVREEKACPAESLAKLPTIRSTMVEPLLPTLKPECAKAVDDLYADAMTHWENYATNPAESVASQRRRVQLEVTALRTKATRSKFLCP